MEINFDDLPEYEQDMLIKHGWVKKVPHVDREIVNRLKKLEEISPGQNKSTYGFSKMLGSMLDENDGAGMFVILSEILYTVQSSYFNSFLLRKELPKIAAKVCKGKQDLISEINQIYYESGAILNSDNSGAEGISDLKNKGGSLSKIAKIYQAYISQLENHANQRGIIYIKDKPATPNYLGSGEEGKEDIESKLHD